MKRVIDGYQEIAAIRMRKVRSSVLENRDFLEGLNDIHGQVKTIYHSQFGVLSTKKKTLRPTNGKTVSVLLSANTGLYGDIIRKTFDLFYTNVKESDTDVAIVGRYGRKFYEGSDLGKPFDYFDFSDSGRDVQNAKNLLEHILLYESVIVYHGYFQDILSQVPQKTSVTGKQLENPHNSSGKSGGNRVQYIFEPSIDSVIAFFEGEILTSIFEQSIFESSLSKFASRMISMDYASVNLKNSLKRTNFKLRKSKHRRSNVNQLGTLSGISLWEVA